MTGEATPEWNRSFLRSCQLCFNELVVEQMFMDGKFPPSWSLYWHEDGTIEIFDNVKDEFVKPKRYVHMIPKMSEYKMMPDVIFPAGLSTYY